MAFLENQPATAQVLCDICQRQYTIGIAKKDDYNFRTNPWERKTVYFYPHDPANILRYEDVCDSCNAVLTDAVQNAVRGIMIPR